ncbi:hypothetical protein FRX31_011612 [Thalictrum thalictroides]|uniref:Uncharacterized protein n=1 Tax=Thalictrum thalictroides TaxID=46969 RepID=A0A7J6WN40_THATH|nr:hypothetical protein FRX31_011612 [Thalictrum thalictroides]
MEVTYKSEGHLFKISSQQLKELCIAASERAELPTSCFQFRRKSNSTCLIYSTSPDIIAEAKSFCIDDAIILGIQEQQSLSR